MITFPTLIFLLLACGSVIAQNYRPVNPLRTAHFLHGDTVFSVRIDSTSISGNDTVLFNFRMINPNQVMYIDSCIYLHTVPWIGDKIINRYQDGNTILITGAGDSVFIKSISQKGDSWNLFYFSNGNKMVATVDTIIAENVLSISDSVKIISLAVEDSVGNIVSNFFNGQTIKLAKNSGLVKTFNICRFPDDTSVYSLIGLTNPDAGITNFEPEDFFDMEVGDEIHLECDLMPNAPYQKHVKRIILQKQVSANWDTLTFVISDTIFLHHMIPNPDTVFPPYVWHDSLFTQNDTLQFIPEQIIMDRFTLELSLDDINANSFIVSPNIILYGADFNFMPRIYSMPLSFLDDFDGDSCYATAILAIECYPDYCHYFISGIGGHYNCYGPSVGLTTECCDYWHETSVCLNCHPVYFSGMYGTWGTPIDFDSLITRTNKTFILPKLQIFVNGNYLEIVNSHYESKPISIILYDIPGRKVIEEPMKVASGERGRVAIDKIQGGIYVGAVISDDIIIRKKIFIYR